MTDWLQVTDAIAIPRSELVYRASRAGGAGGQHVNTSSTRIELLWSFRDSTALTDPQKDRLAAKLASRLNTDGWLHVGADNRRSQLQNKVAADERLATLVRAALHTPKTRRATRPTKASKERRLTGKKKRSEKKGLRRKDSFD